MKKIVALVAVVLLVISAVVYTSMGMTKKNNSNTRKTVQSHLAIKDITKFELYIKLIGLSKKNLSALLVKNQLPLMKEG